MTGTPNGREGPRHGHDPDGPNDWSAALPAILYSVAFLIAFAVFCWWMATR